MLAASPCVGSVEVRDTDPDRLREASGSFDDTVTLGQGLAVPDSADLVVAATTAGTQTSAALSAMRAGAGVVTTTNEIIETRDLLALDRQARQHGVPLVVGAGFMPGLTCLMARVGAAEFDLVDEIHVAKVGTGGPACARQHHRALSSLAIDWRDGRWTRRPGGSGRELCWFPDPVAGHDCYRGALPDALLLVPAFPGVDRVTARMAATRRDRLTAPLPMMRRPHPEGGVGAVRVELRGRPRHRTPCGGARRPGSPGGGRRGGGRLNRPAPPQQQDRARRRRSGVDRQPGGLVEGSGGSEAAALQVRGIRAVTRCWPVTTDSRSAFVFCSCSLRSRAARATALQARPLPKAVQQVVVDDSVGGHG